MTYAAFLRGINVGGHKKVPMQTLREAFEVMGFEQVRTFIASGNVLFETRKMQPRKLAESISAKLEQEFGFSIPVIVVESALLEKMKRSEPFSHIPASKDIRLYVTFLSGKPSSTLTIPYRSPDGSFTILEVTDDVIYSMLDVSKTGTPEAMSILEKEFGKQITTRNWNTIIKMVEALH